MNTRPLMLLIFAFMLSTQALASPNLSISPTQPVAKEAFNLFITENSYPNGCVPQEIFSIRLYGNKLKVTALPPASAVCTQAISSYSLKNRYTLIEPGNYVLEYYLGFNSSPVAFLPFTVLPNPGATHERETYEQGYFDGQDACRLDPQSCGILIEPVTFYGEGVLDIPKIHVVGPFNEVTLYSAVLQYIPFSVPVLFELKAVEVVEDGDL